MAYRKTEHVLAGMALRKEKIISRAIRLISRRGMEHFTTDKVAAEADVSVGLIYKYFPDVAELQVAVVAQLLSRDLILLREAGSLDRGIRAWAKHLAANYRLMVDVGATLIYREGIRAELAKMLRAAGVERPTLLSAVVYGAVLEAAATLGPRDGTPLTEALLRAVGVRVAA